LKQPDITVFGGSGFLGRSLVKRLAESGYRVRVAVRNIEAASFLKVFGDTGQVVPWPANITQADQVANAIHGSEIVVNLVGILFKSKHQKFNNIHEYGAKTIAECASLAGVKRLIHVSAIGAEENSPSEYGRSKAAGIKSVKSVFPNVSIVRPSVIFGANDNFFNLFAGLSRITFALPVFGCSTIPEIKFFPKGGLVSFDFYGKGGTKLQPVYVGDVADAIIRIISDPKTKGQTFDLGGPKIYSFKELMTLLLIVTGRKKLLLPIPFGLAKFIAWFLEFWPTPLLTTDQVNSLKRDNVVSDRNLGFKDLGITPAMAETILPKYLHRFRTPGKK
jgi:NADH dehydrogenase